MRSRYTAYVKGDASYLERTWHHTTRPARLQLDAGHISQWKSLTVLSTQAGGTDDSEGSVEFVARYKINGRAGKLQENSRFVKQSGCWYYLAGDTGQ